MPTHNIIMSYQTGTNAVSGTIAVTDDTEVNADLVLAAASTDVLLSLALTRANVKSLVLYCTAACTVETNSGSAPQETIALTAGIPKICSSAAEVQALISNNVSALYLTCADGGTFSMRAIVSNNTP